jgi:hypothetical protein
MSIKEDDADLVSHSIVDDGINLGLDQGSPAVPINRYICTSFSSTGISDTILHRLLLQASSNTTMIMYHHRHHFPTTSPEH